MITVAVRYQSGCLPRRGRKAQRRPSPGPRQQSGARAAPSRPPRDRDHGRPSASTSRPSLQHCIRGRIRRREGRRARPTLPTLRCIQPPCNCGLVIPRHPRPAAAAPGGRGRAARPRRAAAARTECPYPAASGRPHEVHRVTTQRVQLKAGCAAPAAGRPPLARVSRRVQSRTIVVGNLLRTEYDVRTIGTYDVVAHYTV